MDKQGNEYTLASGATLMVGVAPWKDIKALHDAVLNEIRGQGVSGLDVVAIQKAGTTIAARMKGKAADLEGAGPGFNHLADRVLGILASKAVEECIFKCAEKSIYRHDGTDESTIKVTKTMFDDPKIMEKARGDFYEIGYHVAEVNLRPFVKALSSALGVRVGQSADTQKSSVTSEKPNLSPLGSQVPVTEGVTRSAS